MARRDHQPYACAGKGYRACVGSARAFHASIARRILAINPGNFLRARSRRDRAAQPLGDQPGELVIAEAASPPPKTLAYRSDLDGLRAISVITVMIVHAFPGKLPFGYFSIDVFFLISGYLITTLLVREAASGHIDMGRFYARRIRRLFPSLIFILGICLAAGFVLLRVTEFQNLTRHILGSLGFIQNFIVMSEIGYFDSAARSKPLLHFWTLAVEEQFYIVWPLLLLAAGQRSRVRAVMLATILVASFALAISGTIEPKYAYYSPLTRAWVIASGAALALWQGRIRKGPSRTVSKVWRECAAAIALMVLLLSFVWSPVAGLAHPGIPTLLPVAATLILIATGPDGLVHRYILANPIIAFFGLVSYPLYLWHWPLLSFPYIVFGELPPREWRAGALILAVALAWATTRYIERPLRFGWSSRAAVTVLAAGAIGLALVSLIAIWLHTAMRPTNERAAEAQMTGAAWRFSENGICKARYGTGYRNFCMQNRTGVPTLMLFGTSFANHFYAGVVANDRLRDENILSYGSCEPSGIYPGLAHDCARQEEILRITSSIRVVVVGNEWPRFDERGRMIDNASASRDGYESNPNADAYYAALSQRLQRIARSDRRIVITGPKPETGYDIADCYPRMILSARQDCRTTLSEARIQTDSIKMRLRNIARITPNAIFVDQLPVFCDDTTCRFKTKNNLPLLRDAGHYSEIGSGLATDLIVSAMRGDARARIANHTRTTH